MCAQYFEGLPNLSHVFFSSAYSHFQQIVFHAIAIWKEYERMEKAKRSESKRHTQRDFFLTVASKSLKPIVVLRGVGQKVGVGSTIWGEGAFSTPGKKKCHMLSERRDRQKGRCH